MSRIGNQPIVMPQGVKVTIKAVGEAQHLVVEGPKGKLERGMRPEVSVAQEENQLVLTRKDDSKPARAFHGLERALINNMVVGVSEGYEKQLAFIGVGYRADVKGNTLNLGLGYSHPIDFELPEGVKGSLLKEGREIFVKLESIDKQLLGQVAAQIRSLRPPEPYKGKGVRYRGEVVKTKAGKAGKAGG